MNFIKQGTLITVGIAGIVSLGGECGRRAMVNCAGSEPYTVKGCVERIQQFGIYSDVYGMIDGRDIVLADRELQDYRHRCDATVGKCYQFQVEDIYPWLVRHEQAVTGCREVK